METALRVMRAFAGAPVATVVGQGVRLDPMGAAFVNAIASNLLDYDDTHLDTVIHPAAPVAPALLALAEQRGLSGAAVLHAFLLGGEVECRIGGRRLARALRARLAHHGHLRRVRRGRGLREAARPLRGADRARAGHRGEPVRRASWRTCRPRRRTWASATRRGTGMLAALLAAEGYEAAPAAIEGPLGWARAMGDVPDARRDRGGPRRALGDRAQHLQALSGGNRLPRGDRRLPPAARGGRGAARGDRRRRRRGRRAAARARRPRRCGTSATRGSASTTAPPWAWCGGAPVSPISRCRPSPIRRSPPSARRSWRRWTRACRAAPRP